MRWTVHGERPIYESEWVRLTLADVELPDGKRFDHHVVRTPRAGAGVVVHDDERGVLMLWRHRFITDTWGWEIPAGRVDPGESAVEAAAREVLEETGWRPHALRPLVHYHPSNGISDQRFDIFAAEGATHVGPPTDPSEAERIEWVPTGDLREIIAAGQMGDGLSLTAVLYALAFGFAQE
ncbi:NUDIX hydrolase [Actinopolymorpha sp. B11F2]|uniref:NUDIX hydrolase n=1 Tax=Actinopolymorpha sp. B11F2 TaxID=3160862 RepID=UPI0032E37B5B